MVSYKGPAFQTLNQTFESVIESERVFRNFRNLILTSFLRNFWKVRNRTNSEFSVNSECSETRVSELFDPQTGFIDPQTGFIDPQTGVFDPKTGNYFQTYFQTIFAKFLRVKKVWVFPKKNLNFKNQTFPKLAKTKSSEISV